jgi:hypothetical protein
MAMQTVTVTLAGDSTKTFTFTQPYGNYGKTAGLTITNGDAPPLYSFAADSGSGTITGTINLSAATTGTVDICVFDKP